MNNEIPLSGSPSPLHPSGGGGGGSGAGLRRPAERTMAAQPRGVIETAERSSRTESRGRRAAPIHHQQKQQTDMNRPEDVIRWPGAAAAAAPAPGDSQMWSSSCRPPSDCEVVGYYSEQVGGDEEENAQAEEGHGKQILSLQNDSVQVTYYRQQREREAARRRLSSGGDCGVGGDTRRDCGAQRVECCTTRTRSVAEARTPTRHSFASNCMEAAATMLQLRRRPPLLVTVLLCTYLMLSSLPAVAFAARQQDGKWDTGYS